MSGELCIVVRLVQELIEGVDEVVEATADPLLQSDDKIVCRACERPITRAKWAIRRNGAFQHRFRNPAGWSFQVGCYAQAPGALASGIPTSDHSWFSGFAWCYACCAGCGSHLGWWYVGRETFAGLIVTRLR